MVADGIREGSSPDFCPPTKEGLTLGFVDEAGDAVELEFLGLLLHNGCSYGFFFPVDEYNPALSSGEVVVLEVTELDEDGQPESFELVDDESLVVELYKQFRVSTKDLYRFE